MQVIADLQLHSKYSRAVSQQMVIPNIWEWANKKGIGLIATGDWNHPLWMREIKSNLEEPGNGLLKLKANDQSLTADTDGPLFLLATEVSCIYSQGGKQRRIHTLIWSPSIETAEKINAELTKRGANLMSDGRPIVGLTSIQIAEIVLSINPLCLVIPAHIWTPWFSLYGSMSGFDSIEECFGRFAKNIYAVETGLSSSPAMNWRIKNLDTRAIVSFSDAHSGPKLGREATVFEIEELSYHAIREAIMGRREVRNGTLDTDVRSEKSKSQEITPQNPASHFPSRISYTIEFYPEEGKYHYTGHRNCNVKQTPQDTKTRGVICPVCGKRLTVGVMQRVEDLAGRTEEELKLLKKKIEGIDVYGTFSQTQSHRPPYVSMVPLQEILAECFGGQPTSANIQSEYEKLVNNFRDEFSVLLKINTQNIAKISGEKVAQAIEKVRKGDIFVDPGYDGVFGKVKLFSEEKKNEEEKKDQLSLF